MLQNRIGVGLRLIRNEFGDSISVIIRRAQPLFRELIWTRVIPDNSRYCTPPCTRRTVGAPLCGRRAAPPGSPRRGLCAVGWNVGAPRRSRCDAGLPPRTASRSRSLRLIVRELTLI